MSEFDPDIKNCWVTWHEVGFGITELLCFSKKCVHPIGMIWAQIVGRGDAGKVRAEIFSSFTIHWARRKGVRTLLNRTLFEKFECDLITTVGSTKTGRPFLRRSGYELDRKSTLWILTRRKFEQMQRRRRRAPGRGKKTSRTR